MAEEKYSVKAILSAADKGFSSTMKSAMGYCANLKNTLTSGLGFGIMMAAGEKAFSVVTSGLGELVGEMSASSAAWKTFQGNMQMNGKTKGQIAEVKKELQDFAQATVYSSSDMASTFAQLEAVGTKNTAKLVKGFGGLAAAAENPQQAMKTLSQQATQMAAKPKVAWEDFKLMLEQTPAGISAVAKTMGKSTKSLIKDIQAGKVKTEEFLDAIAKTGTNADFTKLATEYKTVGQAVDGLQETLSNKLQPTFARVSDKGIAYVSKLSDKIDSINFDAIAGKAETLLSKAKPYWDTLSTSAVEVKDAFGEAFRAIGGELKELTKSFGSTESIKSFSGVVHEVAGDLKGVAGFLKEHDKIIAKVITKIPQLVVAYKGFKIAKAVAPGMLDLSSAIGSLAKKGISKIAPNLFKISKGQKEVGKSSGSSSKKILASAKAFMMLGTGVALISGGFFLLAKSAVAVSDAGPLAVSVLAGLVLSVSALSIGMFKMLSSMSGGTKKLSVMSKAMLALGTSILLISTGFILLTHSAIKLANAGGLAIGVMVGLGVALAGMMAGMVLVLKTLAPMSAQLMPVATAMLALGAAVLIVSTGFALLALTSIQLANAGGLAIGIMVGMVATIALLAVGAAALGPALTAGALGFVAFGTAIVLVATGALLASAALAIVATVLPTVCEYGLQGALAITALGAAMLIFSVGATVAGIGCVALAAGLALVGAAVLITSAGVILLATGVLALGAGLTVCGMAVTLLAISLPTAAAGALLCAAGFTAMSAGAVMLGAALLVLTASITAFGVVLVVSTAGVAGFGLAMTASAVGVVAMAAALKTVNSSMKSIAKNAKSTQKSLNSMKKSVKLVESGLDALGSKAKTSMKSLVSAFDNTASKAKSSGQKVGQGFTQGMQAGLAVSTIVARSTVSLVTSTLRSGRSGAYSAGSYISQGFAQGMRSQLGVIRSVASQMASAANAAIRAKAKIHSPSKVTDQLGQYYGQGWINGMQDKVHEAYKTAEKFVVIPTLKEPKLAMAGYGNIDALDENYSYNRNATYTVIVPVELDGKEVARITAPYTEEELNKRERRNRRKKGKV